MRNVLAGLAVVLAAAAGETALAQVKLTPAPPGQHVEDPRKLPEPAPTIPSLAYDSRIIASAASAEQFQGPLDGGWVVGTGAGDLYGLQLVDKRNVVEGAWRDLRRKGDPAASGVLDQALRTATGLVLRFKPAGQQPVTVSLRPNFRGELSQGGKVIAVAMRKAGPN